jgi:hypothetical protein
MYFAALNVTIWCASWEMDGGRPKIRWLDCIESDLKFVSVKRWRKKAEDRSVWTVILKEAVVKL